MDAGRRLTVVFHRGGMDAAQAPTAQGYTIGACARFIILMILLLVAGCASKPPLLPSLLASRHAVTALELEAVTFYPQQQYQCGPAALATLLDHSGVPATTDELVPLVYLPDKKGSLQVEMVAASRRFGRIPYQINPDLSALIEELQAGRPVLVLQNLGLKIWPVWHYAVVIGYSVTRDELILRSGVTRRETLSTHRFLDTWAHGDNWAMVLLKPGELPARPEQLPYLKAVAAIEESAPAESLISAYQAGLDLWPKSQIALFGLAASLHIKGELMAAEHYYRKILAAQPDHMAAHNNLAEVLADRGCFAEALDTIERALRQETGELRQYLLDTSRELKIRKANQPLQSSSCHAINPATQ